MTKHKTDYRIVIAGIIGLVALEFGAMYNGINGTMLTIVVAAIAGLAGWAIPSPRFIK